MQIKIEICMKEIREKFDHAVNLLQCIHAELKQFLQNTAQHQEAKLVPDHLVHIPFKGTELYLLHKAFIDAGGAPSETYKSLVEKTAPQMGNKNQKGFSVESLQKNSDKVDYESKENVKRFFQKMIRNIDSY
jgi:hypothetical protein